MMERHNLSTPRRLLVMTMLAVMMVLAGCAMISMSFGYRHADWLIRRQLDHYLDFSSAQRRDVTAKLQTLLLRHRTEALPAYEEFLSDIQRRLARGLEPEDLTWIYASYDRFRADLFERVAPDSATLMTTLTDAQIQNFEAVLLKEANKAERGLREPAGTRLEERAKSMLSMAQDWLGPLSAEQRAGIRRWSVDLPDTQPAWYQYRQYRQRELVTLMRNHPPAGQAAQALRAMFVSPERSAPRTYMETVKEFRAELTSMLLKIDRTLTPLQRRQAIATLQQLIDDIHDLRAG